jgi:hypothetical protein
MKRLKSRKKALSGAVTALILVIASVIIALVVVGFAFGLFGAFGAQPRIQLVNAYISGGTLYIILQNTGNANGAITGIIVNGNFNSISSVQISAGSTTTLTLAISSIGISSVTAGQSVSFTLITSNGVDIPGTAIVVSS